MTTEKKEDEMEKTGFLQSIADNALFVAEFIGIVVLIILVSYVMEKWAAKRNNSSERVLTTRKVAVIGTFSAIAAILMVFELPVPFAPMFYKIDFSEISAFDQACDIGITRHNQVICISAAACNLSNCFF